MITKLGKNEVYNANTLYHKFHTLNNSNTNKFNNKLSLIGIDLPTQELVNSSKTEAQPTTILMRPHSFSDINQTTQNGGYSTKIPSNMYEIPKILTINPNNPLSRLLSPVHKVFSSKEQTATIHNLMTLHELYEAEAMRDANRVTALYKKPSTKLLPIAKRVSSILPDNFSFAGYTKHPNTGILNFRRGIHIDLGVLGRESNDVLDISKSNPNYIKTLTKARRKSGESDLLFKLVGKRYGIDKFTPKDILTLKGLNSSDGLPLVNGVPTKIMDVD